MLCFFRFHNLQNSVYFTNTYHKFISCIVSPSLFESFALIFEDLIKFDESLHYNIYIKTRIKSGWQVYILNLIKIDSRTVYTTHVKLIFSIENLSIFVVAWLYRVAIQLIPEFESRGTFTNKWLDGIIFDNFEENTGIHITWKQIISINSYRIWIQSMFYLLEHGIKISKTNLVPFHNNHTIFKEKNLYWNAPKLSIPIICPKILNFKLIDARFAIIIIQTNEIDNPFHPFKISCWCGFNQFASNSLTI